MFLRCKAKKLPGAWGVEGTWAAPQLLGGLSAGSRQLGTVGAGTGLVKQGRPAPGPTGFCQQTKRIFGPAAAQARTGNAIPPHLKRSHQVPPNCACTGVRAVVCPGGGSGGDP